MIPNPVNNIFNIQYRPFNALDEITISKYGITKDQMLEDGVLPIKEFKFNMPDNINITNIVRYKQAFGITKNNEHFIWNPNKNDHALLTDMRRDTVIFRDRIASEHLYLVTNYWDYRILKNLGINVTLLSHAFYGDHSIIEEFKELNDNIYIAWGFSKYIQPLTEFKAKYYGIKVLDYNPILIQYKLNFIYHVYEKYGPDKVESLFINKF